MKEVSIGPIEYVAQRADLALERHHIAWMSTSGECLELIRSMGVYYSWVVM